MLPCWQFFVDWLDSAAAAGAGAEGADTSADQIRLGGGSDWFTQDIRFGFGCGEQPLTDAEVKGKLHQKSASFLWYLWFLLESVNKQGHLYYKQIDGESGILTQRIMTNLSQSPL